MMLSQIVWAYIVGPQYCPAHSLDCQTGFLARRVCFFNVIGKKGMELDQLCVKGSKVENVYIIRVQI